MAGANQRTQLGAALLAFFLGWVGAHWYYLGEIKKGNTYLGILLISIVTAFLLIGFLGFALLGLCSLIDIVMLLSMEPAEFNRRYN